MVQHFISLKNHFKRAYALWILNNMDLIEGYLNIKYKCLTYLQIGLYCLTLPYQFVKIVAQNLKERNVDKSPRND